MKERGHKRFYPVILVVLAVSIFVLTSCTNQAVKVSEQTTTQQSASQQESSQKPSEPEIINNTYKTGLPIVKDKITMTAVASQNAVDKKPIDEKLMWKQLESETNIAWKVELVPANSYTEKVNLLAASGSLPDVVLQATGDIKDKYYNSGLFVALDELVAEWAPNIKNLYENKDIFFNCKSPDGKVYITPKGEGAPWLKFSSQFFVYKPWLDKLGLKNPETTEEFYNVLKAFKANDLNGNGKKDEIPFSFVANDPNSFMSNDIRNFMGAFGHAPNATMVSMENKKIVFVPTTDGFKETLLYLHKLYKEELIDPESFTQGLAQLKAKGSAEMHIIGTASVFNPNNLTTPERVKDYELMSALKGPNGYQEFPYYPEEGGGGAGLAISKNNKYAEATMRWVDYINSDPTMKLKVMYGPESLGVLETMSDGKLFINTAKVPEGESFPQWSQTEMLRSLVPICLTSEETEKYRFVDGIAGAKLEFVNKYINYKPKELISSPMLTFVNPEQAEQRAFLFNSLKPLVDNFMATSIIQGMTDADWAKFQEELKKAQVNDYIVNLQQSVDAYNK